MKTFKLEELAREAGVSPRTVRYYVQRGLLPAPQFRGKDTAYDEEHLLRLRAIRKLQDQFLPLDAIQAELGRRTSRELEELLATVPRPTPLPPPYRAPPPPLPGRGERWTRFEIAPGVELHVSDRAGATDAWIDEVQKMIVEKGR